MCALEADLCCILLQAIYSWWLYEMCDVFIELSKPVLSDANADAAAVQTTRDTLWVCLDTGLRYDFPASEIGCRSFSTAQGWRSRLEGQKPQS